jgi:hypothetical protein
MKLILAFTLILLSSIDFAQSVSMGDVLQSKVLIIPDNVHGHLQELEYQSIWLRDIKAADSNYDCLLSEIDPRLTVEIRKFLSGATYQSSIQAWQDRLSQEEGMRFLNIIPDWYLVRVQKLGFKVIGVDIDFSTELGKKVISAVKYGNTSSEDYQMNVKVKRTEAMAKSIIKTLANGSCKKAIFVVGGAHLEQTYWQKKSVQDFLEEAGVPYSVLPAKGLFEQYKFH